MTRYLGGHMEWIAIIGFAIFSHVRLRSYLHIFQQEEYDNARFLRWLLRSRTIDRTASLLVLLVSALPLVWRNFPAIITPTLVVIAVTAVAWRERLAQKKAKKPLVLTSRATRTLNLAWVGVLIFSAILAAAFTSPLIWLLAIQLCPFFLVLANLLLSPIEKRVRQRYWNEAHEKLGELKPFIVAVTGSYGKTSVKHILGHILQFHAPTLMTPGSVNTPMGISRVVREQLRPSHKYLLLEMGAYGPGSIRGLCELAPPKLGILTAIGAAHLERFGSLDVTAQAKMEMATAVIANGGNMIINAGLVDIPAVAAQLKTRRPSFTTCGLGIGDMPCTNIVQSKDSLEFDIQADHQVHHLKTPIYGEHQVLNIALAFCAARALGMAPDDIATALKSTPQISHRLEVRRQANGSLIIDDSYNSNPAGFESALRLLKFLKAADSKAYLITPGMVELGSKHAPEHLRLGTLAGELADVIYIVAAHRIPTFEQGIRAHTGKPVVIETFPTFQAAYDRFAAQSTEGDVVLIENDLPDLYERKMRL